MDLNNRKDRGRGETGHFSAYRWERSVAEEFLCWRTATGAALARMRTFAEAIARTLRHDGQKFSRSGELASTLERVLTSCDDLRFDNGAEALAYASLHLLDRYGRVNQVLDYLVRIGRLPLRIRGARVLEVGAGPAPASYATRDFYATLLSWPGLGDVALGPVVTLDTLDRGHAWDQFLHHLSESLISIRGVAPKDGMLTLGRSVHEFKDFDVRRRHHESVAVRAVRIANEFDQTDDPISDATARRMAYEGGVPKPSAYDFIFLCNFLTEPGMTETFSLELRRLASSLTPGGLMVILGGTGQHYPDLYERIREIAATARLRDVSPSKPLPSNEGSALLRLIAEHVRENVEWALANCPSEVRAAAVDKLPSDIVDDTVQFRLPKFQALVFVGQAHVRSGTRKLQRIGIRAE